MRRIATLVILIGLGAVSLLASDMKSAQPASDLSTASAALPETPAKPAAAPAVSKRPLGITYGIDGRVRIDTYNNTDITNGVNDETRFARVRTRIFVNVPIGPNVDGYVRFATEPFKRWATEGGNYNGPNTAPGYMGGDFWFDNVYLDFKKLPIKGVNLRVGRQDILKGDGFFLFSGAVATGPRNGGFDAFNLGYTFGKQKIELMGFWLPQTDDFYPVINQSYQQRPGLMSSPFGVPFPYLYQDMGTQQAAGAYYTGRQFKNTDIDAFYFFVKQYNMTSIGGATNSSGAFTATSAPSFLNTYKNYHYEPDRHTNMLGGRIVQRLPGDITIHGNFTYQFGHQDAMTGLNNAAFGTFANPNGQAVGCAAGVATCGYPQTDIRAWGGYGFVTKYFPKVKTQPYLRFQTMLLSGQDPNKLGTDGNFDTGFARWAFHPSPFIENGYGTPLYSDEYVNSLTAELGINPAYLSNTKNFGAEAGFTPIQGKVRKIQIVGAYQFVNAFHPFVADPIHYELLAGATFPTLIPGTTAGSTCTVAAPCGPLTSGIVPSSGQFSETGLNRYKMAKVDVRFVAFRNFSGYVTFEKLWYGDFYNATWYQNIITAAGQTTAHSTQMTRANSTPFFRLELNYRWAGFLPFSRSKT
jgi:hypothetical protein